MHFFRISRQILDEFFWNFPNKTRCLISYFSAMINHEDNKVIEKDGKTILFCCFEITLQNEMFYILSSCSTWPSRCCTTFGYACVRIVRLFMETLKVSLKNSRHFDVVLLFPTFKKEKKSKKM